MEDNNWIEDLRHKEHDFELRAPEGLWDDIEQSLSSGNRRQRRILPLWLRYGGVAAVALCLAVIVPLLFSEHSLQDDVRMAGSGIIKDRHNFVAEVGGKNPGDAVHEALRPLERGIKRMGNALERHTKVLADASVAVAASDELSEGGEEKEKQAVIEYTDTASSVISPGSRTQLLVTGKKKAVPAVKHLKSGGDWSLTAYAGNLMTNGKSSETGYSPIVKTLSPYGGAADVPIGVNKVYDILTMNRGESVETETHHKLPLRFGLGCGIPISERMSVETGITYSLLSSSTVSGTDKNYFDTEQTLHYIGVPLKLHYNLLKTRKFGVYVSGGGMVEKCVYGSSDTDLFIGSEKASSTSEKVSEKRLQFSVIAGGGLEYRITEALNLFAEPAVSYSFDNHSSVENSYKEHPLNFDLKVGVRFDIKR
ncbi:PorT family protein [Prevotella sp. PINT]|uniref:porin family protein n=1 Tax=Palleniella intestinalis TaxID=2736291 RepID=UPI0015583169|nr:porin family protein [Palleniella intestinalis]NPD82919.1 PorT family protein [Palleniella intestinalis]